MKQWHSKIFDVWQQWRAPLKDKKNHRVEKIKKQKNITEPYDYIKQPNVGVTMVCKRMKRKNT